MKNIKAILVTAGAVTLGVLSLAALSKSANAGVGAKVSPAVDPKLVKRGEYLVHNVGVCIDCHSPRNERGEFIVGQHLRGATIAFAPTVPMPAWAPFAPALAGLPAGWSEEAFVEFLKSGVRPHQLPATRPPMPSYRFDHADAEAVAAYIRSLDHVTK